MKFGSRKRIEGGAEWAGEAGVVFGDGVVVVEDVGAWVFADGREVRGSQRMVFGDVIVVGGHEYRVSRDGGVFEAEYLCGEDVYRMWGEWPREEGWKMQMSVVGPRKNEVQMAEYVYIGRKFDGNE